MLSFTENSCRPYPGYLSLTSTGACLRKGCKLWSINRILAHFTMETIARVNSVLFKTVAGTAPDTWQIREITCLSIAHGVEELSLAQSQSHYSPWLALRLRWAAINVLISERVHLQEKNIGCIGMLFPGTFYCSVSEKIFPRNKINAADSSRGIPSTLMPSGNPFRSLEPVRARTNLPPQPEHPRGAGAPPGALLPPVPARPARRS